MTFSNFNEHPDEWSNYLFDMPEHSKIDCTLKYDRAYFVILYQDTQTVLKDPSLTLHERYASQTLADEITLHGINCQLSLADPHRRTQLDWAIRSAYLTQLQIDPEQPEALYQVRKHINSLVVPGISIFAYLGYMSLLNSLTHSVPSYAPA